MIFQNSKWAFGRIDGRCDGFVVVYVWVWQRLFLSKKRLELFEGKGFMTTEFF